jgi:ethanolamine ammonia-lyase large subunit
MTWSAVIRGQRYTFGSLGELFAKANEPKSGDALAGLAPASETERVAAKMALADVRLAEIVDVPLVEDEVTEAVLGELDHARFRARLGSLTVGEFREMVLSDDFAAGWQRETLHQLVTPEIAAATAKLMSNLDLIRGSRELRVVTSCRSTVGQPGVLASRLQPNHPTDEISGIAYSIVDGLSFGTGDAVIGVNPAVESVGTVTAILRLLEAVIDELEVPTQGCVLAHATTQLQAIEQGATVDLLFQSVAGTAAANRAFGIDLALLREASDAVLGQHRDRPDRYQGRQAMYFETGQGSALSADAHHGIDQLTCEARAQAVARLFDPFLVNSVVGFIGPEYLADSAQITRAGLEDHFVGKLMGLPMGCDVCFTNHVDADHNSNDNLLVLLVLLAAAGCNFVMGVPAGDDIMLGYQSTSHHDVATVRDLFGLSATPEFASWFSTRFSGRRDLGARLLPDGLGERIGLTAAGPR